MERDVIVADYRDKRRELKKAILRAKINSWKQLQEDTNIWGYGYKIVKGKLKPQTSRR